MTTNSANVPDLSFAQHATSKRLQHSYYVEVNDARIEVRKSAREVAAHSLVEGDNGIRLVESTDWIQQDEKDFDLDLRGFEYRLIHVPNKRVSYFCVEDLCLQLSFHRNIRVVLRSLLARGTSPSRKSLNIYG